MSKDIGRASRRTVIVGAGALAAGCTTYGKTRTPRRPARRPLRLVMPQGNLAAARRWGACWTCRLVAGGPAPEPLPEREVVIDGEQIRLR